MVSRTFDTAYIRKYKHCTLCLVTQSCSTLCDPVDCSPPGTSVHGDSLGKNTGVGSLSLLQGIFLTQGSDPGLPPCRQILYHLSHQGSPRTMEWVAYPISREFPWPRNGTWISCIAGGSFISWATREAHCTITFYLPILVHWKLLKSSVSCLFSAMPKKLFCWWHIASDVFCARVSEFLFTWAILFQFYSSEILILTS